jgi:iron complex transport system substrate-binding protein
VISRRAAALGLAGAGLHALAGCSRPDAGAADAGAGPSASGATAWKARRIVSISPSATEAVFALGRGADLVGRSSFCDEPPQVKSVPEVGGFADPSLERIVAREPTLVVGERGPAGPRLVEALEQRGIATYFPPITSIADIESFLLGLGERLAATDEARRITKAIGLELQLVGEQRSRVRRPRVAFLFDFKPIIVAGPGSFPDEVLRRACADNVVTSGSIYPQLGPEGLLALDPEIVIDGSAPGAYAGDPIAILQGIEGLASLRAIREKRVARLAGTSALRPGPRIAAGVREVAELIDRLRAPG